MQLDRMRRVVLWYREYKRAMNQLVTFLRRLLATSNCQLISLTGALCKSGRNNEWTGLGVRCGMGWWSKIDVETSDNATCLARSA